ncbi:MAG: S-layer homology domain-containing protein [Ruminococcaceae bacterium]|nr:S-layer homology domain-containing protein [Oscillospiraceae bacterium]
MKLWQKGTAALLLLFMILLQSVAFASGIPADVQKKAHRLEGFGIITQSFVADHTPVTRGEMADLVVRATNNVVGAGQGVSYTDVPASHPYCGAIEAANSLGITGLNEEKTFNPDGQISKFDALVMICNAMGYADIALSYGGYPTGYTKLANEQGLTKGVTNEYLTREDVVRLLSNMMDGGAVKHVFYENNPALVIDTDVTYIEDAFEVTKYKAEVSEVDTTNRRITAKITSGRLEGTVAEFMVDQKVNLQTVGGRVVLYVDDNDFEYVKYIEIKGTISGESADGEVSSGVINDFISETNKNDVGSEITISDWKYVAFTNAEGTYKLDDSVVITYNDRVVQTEAYNYVGTFCKAVVQDGLIVRMDIYPLKEGGIIYRADKDELRFSVGTEYENYWQGLSGAPDLQIYIDGKASNNLQDLKRNMVFDYWHEGGSKFIIVASSRVAKGVLEDMDEEYVEIGGAEYRISEPYGWYSFSTQKLGFIPGNYEDVYGKEVTAYLDDNQRVRYVLPEIGKEENAPFKGFVVRTYGEADESERSIKIHRVDGEGVQTYPVKEKLRGSSLSFEYAQSVQSNLDALGFLEFTLDSNGEICKIEQIENFGNDVRHHSGFFPSEYHTIGNLYADEADIYAIMMIDGVFTVKFINYANDLVWTQPGPSGVKVISDFDLRENPVANYIVLGRGSEEISDNPNEQDIIESVKWTGVDDTYTIKFLGGDTFNVEKSFVDQYGLKKNCMVKYGEKSLGKYKIKISSVSDYSGDCSTWDVDTYRTGANRGFYRASSIIERNNDVIQFMADGIPTDVYLYKNDSTAGYYAMRIYEYLGKGKIQKARDSTAVGTNVAWYIRPVLKYPVMNIQKGDDVWFHLYDDGSGMMQIDYMIYKSNNKFFE